MTRICRHKVLELMARKRITTLKQLATAMGISATQLSNILSDKFGPVKSNVVELAEFLGVSPLEIIEEVNESVSTEKE